jgi:hypothetical protein
LFFHVTIRFSAKPTKTHSPRPVKQAQLYQMPKQKPVFGRKIAQMQGADG